MSTQDEILERVAEEERNRRPNCCLGFILAAILWACIAIAGYLIVYAIVHF